MLRSLIISYLVLKTSYILLLLFPTWALKSLPRKLVSLWFQWKLSRSGPVSTTTDFVVSIMTHYWLVLFNLWVCFVMNFIFLWNQNYRGQLKDPHHQYWLESFWVDLIARMLLPCYWLLHPLGRSRLLVVHLYFLVSALMCSRSCCWWLGILLSRVSIFLACLVDAPVAATIAFFSFLLPGLI